MTAAIWWVRRDLRLADNPALMAALAHASLVPVFILDHAILKARTLAAYRTSLASPIR